MELLTSNAEVKRERNPCGEWSRRSEETCDFVRNAVVRLGRAEEGPVAREAPHRGGLFLQTRHYATNVTCFSAGQPLSMPTSRPDENQSVSSKPGPSLPPLEMTGI
jgi:hypothetical protein